MVIFNKIFKNGGYGGAVPTSSVQFLNAQVQQALS